MLLKLTHAKAVDTRLPFTPHNDMRKSLGTRLRKIIILQF